MRERLDYLLTLLWVNWQRAKRLRPPVRRLPEDAPVANDAELRSETCPIARATGLTIGGRHWGTSLDGILTHNLPAPVRRQVRRIDRPWTA